jgi:hypothetical protein
MKFTSDRPYGDPEKAARKLIEIANSVEPAQDGRIFIELINWPFLSEHRGSPAEYKAGLDLAITRGWLVLHESGTYVKHSCRRGTVRIVARKKRPDARRLPDDTRRA